MSLLTCMPENCFITRVMRQILIMVCCINGLIETQSHVTFKSSLNLNRLC